MLFGVKTLLQAFLNSNSHRNGHTDHGVVACAQEAHHFHVKSACRRLFACGTMSFHVISQIRTHIVSEFVMCLL